MAGFAVVDGDSISASSSLPAPSADDSRSLAELYRQAHDLIGSYRPEVLALLRSEQRNAKTLGIARQAEGAILAAAGHRDCALREWKTGVALRWPVGLSGTASNSQTYEEVLAMIRGAEGLPVEVGYAAAAALAAARA